MLSSYFKEQKFDLNAIQPIIDLQEFKTKTQDFWYLKNHDYQPFAFIDDLFSESEITKIIALGNLYAEEQGQIGGEMGKINNDIRACKVSWMFPNNYSQWIYHRITDAINQINEQIFKFDLTKIETFQFTKYKEEEKGFYEKHTDSMIGNYLPENRKLSIVMQLSDSNEYEGGELYLHNGKYPTIIEKKKGRIIFFPSYTLHEVTPVTKGTRYTLVGWTHGPAFK